MKRVYILKSQNILKSYSDCRTATVATNTILSYSEISSFHFGCTHTENEVIGTADNEQDNWLL